MRLAGTLTDPDHARRFRDFLTANEIECSLREHAADSDEPTLGVWVLDEQHLEYAREQLIEFLAEPERPTYREAEARAAAIRKSNEAEARRKAKREVEIRERWRPPTWRDVPLTLGLILVSGAIQWVLGWLANDPEAFNAHPLTQDLLFAPELSGKVASEYPLIPPGIAGGEVWRLVSPIVLHIGFMHLILNSMMMFRLGVLIEARRGTARFFALVVFTAVLSNFAQYWADPPRGFGGLSGVLFGLVGFAWMRSRYEPRHGIMVSPHLIAFALFWLVLCMVNTRVPIANTAHTVGLLAGMAAGIAPTIARRISAR